MGYTIAFQEVPDEVSLVISVSGCPFHCNGCHSEYLREYVGAQLSNDFSYLLEDYADYVTCICFMGGDQNPSELKQLCAEAKQRGLKTALYSGNDHCPKYSFLDYVKIGHYDAKMGGLSCRQTNQHFYQKKNGEWKDITYKFWRDKK